MDDAWQVAGWLVFNQGRLFMFTFVFMFMFGACHRATSSTSYTSANTQLAVVFFSTSPSSPFLAALSPEAIPQSPPPIEPPQLTCPIPDRGAFYLNGGRIFDPCLVGYDRMRQAWVENGTAGADTAADMDPSAQQAVSSEAKEPGHWPGKWKLGLSTLMFDQQHDKNSRPRRDAGTDSPRPGPSYPATPPVQPLPPGYLDLRIGGVGLVVDVGWKRTEQGLDWELAEHKHAADLWRHHRAERELRRKQRAGEPAESPRGRHDWSRVSLLGPW